MPRQSTKVKVNGVVASVVNAEGSQGNDPFNQNLQDEKNQIAEERENLSEVAKALKGDPFTKMICEIFDLPGIPSFRTDYCDTRWPRMENGANIFVERCYFLAVQVKGADREIDNIKVIIDRIAMVEDPHTKTKSAFWSDEQIQARKWTCESSSYRYLWIFEDEKIDFDPNDKNNLIYKRLAKLEKKPEFAYADCKPFIAFHPADPKTVLG